METLQKSPVANKLLPSLMVKASNAYGDVAKNAAGDRKSNGTHIFALHSEAGRKVHHPPQMCNS